MYKEHFFTKVSLGIDIATVFIIMVYFFAIIPYYPITGLGGLLILSPPLFGMITALIGQRKSKTNLGKALIIVNAIFLCWWPIIWYGGTLLFGI